MRFEPQVGIRRRQKVAELNRLATRFCKGPGETTLLLAKVDRRKRGIEEIGAQAPNNDVLTGILDGHGYVHEDAYLH